MRAVIYARVSTEEQAEKELSIPSQIEICRKYAEQNNMEVVDVFVDAGKSGTSDEREQFKRLITLVKQQSKIFDVILVYNYSRFSRNELDSIVYEQLIERNNIKLISVTQPLPEDSAIRTLVRGIFRVIDSWYATNAAQEAKRGLVSLAKQGYYFGGSPPYGYTIKEVDNKRKVLEPDPQTAPIVRHIFERVAEGYSYSEIIEELQHKGIPAPRGQFWKRNTLTTMLRNPVYKGCLVYGKKTRAFGGRKWNDRSSWLMVENAHEAIVPAELWEVVQRRHPSIKVRKDSASTMTGILKCAKCGANMWYRAIYKKGKKYGAYICSNKLQSDACDMPQISAKELENFLLSRIIEVLLVNTPEKIVSSILESFNKDDTPNEIEELKERLKKTEKKLFNLISIAEEAEDIAVIKDRIKQLQEEKEALLKEIEKKNTQAHDIKMPDKAVILESLIKLQQSTDVTKLDKQDIKTLFHTLLKEVQVNTETGDIKITMRIPLDNAQQGENIGDKFGQGWGHQSYPYTREITFGIVSRLP